jgi:hypothetical protein
MATYTLPERNSGPTVADLEGKLLAIEPSKVAVEPTKYGEKLLARARVIEIHPNGTWNEIDDDMLFAQQVIVEELERTLKNEAGYLVGRLIRPGKAWLLEAPDPDELELVDKVMSDIDVANVDEAF